MVPGDGISVDCKVGDRVGIFIRPEIGFEIGVADAHAERLPLAAAKLEERIVEADGLIVLVRTRLFAATDRQDQLIGRTYPRENQADKGSGPD